MSESDSELLQRFARDDSQEAFTDVVNRHLDLVYSVALRQVRSSQLAEEVAQSVFLDLARACRRMRVENPVSAWLYVVARRAAIDVVRREARRRARERAAVEISAMNHPETDWARIEPVLDEAMSALAPQDRGAVVLRFFENKSLREVGAALGASENAAQKRLARALEQLREDFARRGIPVSAAAIAAGISGNALHAAPVGLTAAIAAGIATKSVAAAGAIVLMNASTVKTVVVAVAIVTGFAGFFLQMQANRDLHAQVKSLEGRMAREGRNGAGGAAASAPQGTADGAEIERLRAEVERLSAVPPPNETMAAWVMRLASLKQRMARQPEQNIPELHLVTDEEWLDASKRQLETEEDFRTAMADIRNYAEGIFSQKFVQPALKRYLESNGGQFPSDLSQLQPYFDEPIEPTILARWTIVPATTLSSGRSPSDRLVTQKGPIDPEHDHRRGIGATSQTLTTWPIRIGVIEYPLTLAPVLAAYRAANGGQDPSDPSQIQPFVTTPNQQTMLQRVLASPPGAPAPGPTPAR